MEGVQGWMAELEKKQERITRVGGIAVGLAVLVSAGALALGILNKQDAATTDDVDELTEKVNELGASVQHQTEKQLNSINQRLGTVEQQITSINERQRKAEADIASSRSGRGRRRRRRRRGGRGRARAGAGAEKQRSASGTHACAEMHMRFPCLRPPVRQASDRCSTVSPQGFRTHEAWVP